MNDEMLTTYDNVFNPFENFEAWWKEDLRLGHDCCGMLAKVASLNEVGSDSVNDAEVSRAMDEIIASEPTIYKKVTRTEASNPTMGA